MPDHSFVSYRRSSPTQPPIENVTYAYGHRTRSADGADKGQITYDVRKIIGVTLTQLICFFLVTPSNC